MNAIGNEYRLVVLSDLSERTGDEVRNGMVGSLRVPGGNDNGM